ncbi:hypothetical protein M3Y97_00973800 [Aphelenchoides bicaudatus]|nr:hypothetical protein M3Y97_00973800 [Aphelenchoides bicaudatus]
MTEEVVPKALLQPAEKPEHHGSKEKISIFKKTSLIPPSPSRTRKSMSTSKEDCHHLTDSTTSIAEKAGGEREERKHSFLQLFRKHTPSTSLENLPPRTGGRQHRDSSGGTTPSSSLSFLQKLSAFHSSHSPSSNPPSSAFVQMEDGRPTEPLFPLKEMDDLEAAEENAQPSRHPTQPEEIWSEPTTSRHIQTQSEDESQENSPPVKIKVQPPQSPTTERSSPFKRRSAMDEAAREREQVQKALQTCLENFRAGKMRSLTDSQVHKMRSMHANQLRLTELHKRIMDDPLKDDPEVNNRYAEIAKQLNELHQQMDDFASSAGSVF